VAYPMFISYARGSSLAAAEACTRSSAATTAFRSWTQATSPPGARIPQALLDALLEGRVIVVFATTPISPAATASGSGGSP
jgi:hypothetical protein